MYCDFEMKKNKRRDLRDHPLAVKLREKSDMLKAKYGKIISDFLGKLDDKCLAGMWKIYLALRFYNFKYMPKPVLRVQKKIRRSFRTFIEKGMNSMDYKLMYMDVFFITLMCVVEYYEFEFFGAEWLIALFYLFFLVLCAEALYFRLFWIFNFEPFERKIKGHVNTWKARFATVRSWFVSDDIEWVQTEHGLQPVLKESKKKNN